MSIKTRITLWYAALLVAICIFAFFVLGIVSVRAADRYCRDTLMSAATVIIDELDIDEGQFEIDSDIDEVPGIYASLFGLDGELIYGRIHTDAPFESGSVREVHEQRNSWYIYDVLLEMTHRENAWLRVYMSANVNESVLRSVFSSGAWMLPLLSVLALLGGYMITARAFRPVKEMSRLASSIADGADLSRRICFAEKGSDELHALADTFNGMLGRLERVFQQESRFSSDAAHELRTPLNALRAQGEYALSRTNSDEKDEAIGQMLEKSEEMHMLVNQLLMLARIDAHEMQLDEQADLGQIVQSVTEDLEIVAQEKGICIEAELESCMVRGNRSMLTRALINLTDNAIRYGKEGGHVWITLKKDDGSARIAVRDDGYGMSDEEAAHVFERFWRADGARSSGGNGIGLSIVQSVVQAHGGTVTLRSRRNEGSVFEIVIPLGKKPD